MNGHWLFRISIALIASALAEVSQKRDHNWDGKTVPVATFGRIEKSHHKEQVRNGFGGNQFKEEENDPSETVKSSYGYTDKHSFYRIADYFGVERFKSQDTSNEPGFRHLTHKATLMSRVLPLRRTRRQLVRRFLRDPFYGNINGYGGMYETYLRRHMSFYDRFLKPHIMFFDTPVQTEFRRTPDIYSVMPVDEAPFISNPPTDDDDSVDYLFVNDNDEP